MKVFLKEQQVAERLNVSVSTLQAWRWKGFGPSFTKFGKSVRYSAEEIERFVEEAERHSTSEAKSMA